MSPSLTLSLAFKNPAEVNPDRSSSMLPVPAVPAVKVLATPTPSISAEKTNSESSLSTSEKVTS